MGGNPGKARKTSPHRERYPRTMLIATALVALLPLHAPTADPVFAPALETKTFRVTQTVELVDVPKGTDEARLWVPVPGDGPWQRVLDRRIVEAPKGWALVRQPGARGDLVHVSVGEPGTNLGPNLRVVVETLVERRGPTFALDAIPVDVGSANDASLFGDALRTDAPLMTADSAMRALATERCGDAKGTTAKVRCLLELVADAADHYSKDATKPHCGRGAAEDCMASGGGCCTDLHSLFIALARAEGIPARIQFGYRLNPARAGETYDPSYRCWVEYWLPSAGWVPTDIVVADSGSESDRQRHWGRLDANRVWLWEGRGFDLEPKQSAPPIQTMICGWAELDGVAVDPLPAADGAPSSLRRTIRFEEVPTTAAR